MSATYNLVSDIALKSSQELAANQAIETCSRSVYREDNDRDSNHSEEDEDFLYHIHPDQSSSGDDDDESEQVTEDLWEDYESDDSDNESLDEDEPKDVPEGRKCWRCRILREKCDFDDDECVQCFDDSTTDDERQSWDLDCKRGLLATELEVAFSGITEISNGTWWIEDNQGQVFIAKVAYRGLTLDERIENTVRKPITPADRFMTYREFKFSVCDFLQQFFRLDSQWGRVYEPITNCVISLAAKFQLAWLQRANLIPTDLLDKSTMIAAALYCLVLSYDIFQVSIHWRPAHTLSTPDAFHENLAEVERDSVKGHAPSVDIYKLSKGSHIRGAGWMGKQTLGSILRIILQTAQSILFRGRPDDEPYVFYIIYILMLVLGNVRAASEWTEALDPAHEELHDSLHDLCHLFHFSTRCCHPLNFGFDIETYASLVDGNDLVTEHYRALHQLWTDNSDPDDPQEDAEDLWVNVDRFVHGMVC